jgi:hypothetical protein
MIKTNIKLTTNKAFLVYREYLKNILGRQDIKFSKGKLSLKNYTKNRLEKIAKIHAKNLRNFLRSITPNGTGALASGARVIGPSEPKSTNGGFEIQTGIFDGRVLRYRSKDLNILEDGFSQYLMRGGRKGTFNKQKYRKMRAWFFSHLAEIKKRQVKAQKNTLRNPSASPMSENIRMKIDGIYRNINRETTTFVHRGIPKYGMMQKFTDLFYNDMMSQQSQWIPGYLSYVFPFINKKDLMMNLSKGA